MTVEELYNKLCSKEFQDPSNGDLFYNFFVYLYDAKNEYQMREQIADIKEKIKRPSEYIDVLTLDVFEEFCNYLDGKPFGNKYPSYLQYLLEKENSLPDKVSDSLFNAANSDEFLHHIHNKIMEHVSKVDEYKRPYVFLYGLGNIYPYLRASTLLNRYEQVNDSSRYKVILFYPGETDTATFKLFGTLEDNHTYRAIVLMNDK